MSIERTIISRSQPYFISSKAKLTIEIEAKKGCSPDLSNSPVRLEPTYLDASKWSFNQTTFDVQSWAIEHAPPSSIKSYECWMPPEYALEWFKAERFIKILKGAPNKVTFEITGNSKGIQHIFKVTEDYEDLICSAFIGEYSNCELTPYELQNKYYGNLFFNDYFPTPPYHHLFTRPKELVTSVFNPFINTLNKLNGSDIGFFQVLFEPVRNNWHRNVEILNDLEFLSTVINDPRSSGRIKQQLPSADIRNMARDVETKAHNDKPFYSVAVRSGIISDDVNFDISGITSFMNLFQHGGNSLKYLTHKDYEKLLPKEEITGMFENCLTYRPGFLLNSAELSGLVHLPSMKEFSDKKVKLNFLENPLTIAIKESKSKGIIIGHSNYAGEKIPVIIEDSIRKTATHIIGRSGTGKSTSMENMILQDIEENHGVAVIDPHGDTINRILKLIPQEKIKSTIYIDFGDTDWIPIWNPLKRILGQSIGRTADDLVSSFKSIIKSNAWGDRLEHLLRNGFNGLLHLDDSTLYDLLIVFEQSKNLSREKKILTNLIKDVIDNPVAKRFWDKDFSSYRREDFTPPHHKLSKLLNSDESVSLMLTQPDNYLDFKNIMDSGKILLLDLSNVGPDTRKIMGSYLLSVLHNTLISRSKIDHKDRVQFNIYCDEAHKLTTDSLEEMITDARKFGINFTLAHQYLNQFNLNQRDALLSTGATIIFNVDLVDARLLANNLQGKIEVKDIALLKTGEAIARIGTEILKVETAPPKSIPEKNYKDEIIKKSHENYYKPIKEVKRIVEERLKRYGIETHFKEIIPDIEITEPNNQNFEYDEFN